MYSVEIQNPCRCFLRSGMAEMQQFADEADARREAERMHSQMEAEFCKKHEFVVSESYGCFKITIRPRI